MTEAASEENDSNLEDSGGGDDVRAAEATSVSTPRRPSVPRAPRAPRAPRKKRPSRASTSTKPAAEPVHPGPPPPLPSDLGDIVIPPLPPLPVTTTASRAGALSDEGSSSETESEAVAEFEAPSERSDETASTPEPVALEVVEADTEVDAEAEEFADAEAEGSEAAEAEAEAEGSEEAEAEAESETEADGGAQSLVSPDLVISEDGDVEESARVDSGAEPTDALVVRGVTKSFGATHAAEGVSLTVPAGSFFGLVGPNGAGKTTTLSIIAGLLRADSGSVFVAGLDAAASPREVKRMIGVLPDRLRTFDRLTGRQLLYYSGVLRGLPRGTVEARTADLARAFDLTEALSRPVSDYSAGMTKKVMLAGAMIHSPRLLVLDEPFESVDPVSSTAILDILATYVDHGGTVILSSHGMDLVERVCSRVAVLVAGRVLAEGTVDEIRGESTLEERFVELVGGRGDVEGLEWLHTFSD